MVVFIQYYNKGRLVGEGLIKEMSSSLDRRILAKQVGVEQYDRFVLDNGRVDSDNVLPEHKKIFEKLEFKRIKK